AAGPMGAIRERGSTDPPRVALSFVDGAAARIHRADCQGAARRLRDDRAAGIRARTMVASSVSQPARAAHQGGPAVQAEHRRHQRSLPSEKMSTDRVRVVLASRTLVSYVSVWRATTRALVELGSPAFFIGGVAWSSLGGAAPWFVLAAVVCSVAARAADVEARALFIPGGLYGSVRQTLGGVAAKTAASALLLDRLVFGSLAATVAGHYVAAVSGALFRAPLPGPTLSPDTLPILVAILVIGIGWWLQRQGRSVPE